MSVAAPQNTLLYQRKGRPLTLKRDISKAEITAVGSTIRAFGNANDPNAKPESEAIQFYLANHAMKELEFRFDMLEPLPDWALHICNEYHRVSATIAARAFYYMLLITAREARHNQNKHEMQKKIASMFSPQAAMALLHYPDHNSIDMVTQVFDQYAAGANLGDICRSIVYSFYEGKYSGGYGGPKWGNVADCMTAYVTGQSTAEVMLDTVWTLVHNGGPIFNKGMLYQCYNATALQQVLDIQRAGQIPRLVLTPQGKMVECEAYVNAGAKMFAQMVVEKLGPTADFQPGVPVDFQQVQALGAIGDYAWLIKSLEGKKPEPAPAPYQAAQPGYTAKVVPAEKPTEKTHFIIAQKPGLMFKKLTRAEVNA